MEFAKKRQVKDRFIKTSIASLPERFKTKWEITDDIDWDCFEDVANLPPNMQRKREWHWTGTATPEDDENKVYRAMLQSEYLDINNDPLLTDDITNAGGSDYFSMMKYSELMRKEFYSSKPMFMRSKEKIPKAPFKVLDAPALKDDFYLNLIDWSSNNVLAVGLGSWIYLWNASTSKVTKLYDLGNADLVTSVSWSEKGTYLGVGTNSGDFQLWDPEEGKLIKTLQGHSSRIGAVAWNDSIVSTGSRDKSILHRDMRWDSDYEARLENHKQEIWGLKWSFDKQQLASGGNDNKLWLWSIRNSK
jgi:WD40 repeat protein